MRKVILFIASSLDGYIARTSGNVDWLFTDQDYGYTDFFANVDTVLIGRRTYEQVLSFGEYPYEGTQGFVFSRSRGSDCAKRSAGDEQTSRHTLRDKNVEFISTNIPSFIQGVKNSTGKDIWLVGGSEIIQICIQHNLIDEFVISIHPIILGDGIPLFRSPLSTTKLSFQGCKTYETGLVQVTYVRSHEP